MKTGKQMLKELKALKTTEEKQAYIDAISITEAQVLAIALMHTGTN